MKCKKCKKNNITTANYCKYCGKQYTMEEQKQARKKTLVGKLEMIEEFYNICSLKKITDSIIFKIICLVMVIFIGVHIYIKNGNHLKILPRDNYEIQYNEDKNEYYILSKEDSVSLNLFVPQSILKINIIEYDDENKELSNNNYKKDEAIVLKSSSSNYYILDGIYDHKKEDIKMYVYKVKE